MCNGKKLEGLRQVPGKKRGHSGRKNVKLTVGSKGVRQIDWHSLHMESRQKRLQTCIQVDKADRWQDSHADMCMVRETKTKRNRH